LCGGDDEPPCDGGEDARECDSAVEQLSSTKCGCVPCPGGCCTPRFDCVAELGGGWRLKEFSDCGNQDETDCECIYTEDRCNECTQVFDDQACDCVPCELVTLSKAEADARCVELNGVGWERDDTCPCECTPCDCQPTQDEEYGQVEVEDGVFVEDKCSCVPCERPECEPNEERTDDTLCFECKVCPCIDQWPSPSGFPELVDTNDVDLLDASVACNTCPDGSEPVAWIIEGQLPDRCKGCKQCKFPDCSGFNQKRCEHPCIKECCECTPEEDFQCLPEDGLKYSNFHEDGTPDYCAPCVPCVLPTELDCSGPNERWPSTPKEICAGECIPCVQAECKTHFEPTADSCKPCVECVPECEPDTQPDDTDRCKPCVPCPCLQPGVTPEQQNCGVCPPHFERVDPANRCSGCTPCETPTCTEPNTQPDTNDVCNGCEDCPVPICGPGFVPVENSWCEKACEPCPTEPELCVVSDGSSDPVAFDSRIHRIIPVDEGCSCELCPTTCGFGEELINEDEPCAGCRPCPGIDCLEEFGPGWEFNTETRCGCIECVLTDDDCKALDPPQQLDTSTGCRCIPCEFENCEEPPPIEVEVCPENWDEVCARVEAEEITFEESGLPDFCPCDTPQGCPEDQPVDICGKCGGNNSTCTDCEGRIGGQKWVDECGEVCGDGKGCAGCWGENNRCGVCIEQIDLCGVCGGNSDTCYGCDGIPGSGLVYDECGDCGGNGEGCVESTVDEDVAIAVGVVVGVVVGASALIAAGILFRIRKRPDLLTSTWDEALDEAVELLIDNPLAANQNLTGNTNPLLEDMDPALLDNILQDHH